MARRADVAAAAGRLSLGLDSIDALLWLALEDELLGEMGAPRLVNTMAAVRRDCIPA